LIGLALGLPDIEWTFWAYLSAMIVVLGGGLSAHALIRERHAALSEVAAMLKEETR